MCGSNGALSQPLAHQHQQAYSGLKLASLKTHKYKSLQCQFVPACTPNITLDPDDNHCGFCHITNVVKFLFHNFQIFMAVSINVHWSWFIIWSWTGSRVLLAFASCPPPPWKIMTTPLYQPASVKMGVRICMYKLNVYLPIFSIG